MLECKINSRWKDIKGGLVIDNGVKAKFFSEENSIVRGQN